MSGKDNLKVLVVDDSAVMRKVVIGILSQLQIEREQILEAADGEEGVQAALANDVGLILMDWNMPKMLGIDALKAIRAAGKQTPIVMVTTEGEKQNVLTAIQAGASNYLVKPFSAESLREKIEQTLAS
jgi:two-component system chemotaxis response regulator CheY